ncbi:COP9 signalosome complex subunit 1b, partial [Grifola frondosa]
MDIDIIEENEQMSTNFKASGKKPMVVPVDDAHPFDLEAYISSYSVFIRGYRRADRCRSPCSDYIVMSYHRIASIATRHQELLHLRDLTLYHSVFSTYEQTYSKSNGELPSVADIVTTDQKWVDETGTKNFAERSKLEVELKTYSSNMIKESIRMAHRDLGDFYRATGDQSAALKHYTKSREFCTTSQHVLDMCLSILEVSSVSRTSPALYGLHLRISVGQLMIEQRNYAHLQTYVFKAETALDAATNTRANAGPEAPGASQTTKEKKSAEREKVQSKLDIASALAHLGQGHYEKAAVSFLKVGPAKGLEHWARKIIAPGDIAIYGSLCALATFTRSAIRAQVLENDNFGVYIEQEPYIRELIDSYWATGSRSSSSSSNATLKQTRHLIDIHLSPHVTNLVQLIRSRALVLHSRDQAGADGRSVRLVHEELEQQVVALIQAGKSRRVSIGRINNCAQILKAKETDQRAELFARAMNLARTSRRRIASCFSVCVSSRRSHCEGTEDGGQQQMLTGHPSELLITDSY